MFLEKAFIYENNELKMVLKPILHESLFKDGKVSFKFMKLRLILKQKEIFIMR